MQISKNKHSPNTSETFLIVFLLILALICLLLAGFRWWDWHNNTQGKAQPPVPAETVTVSTNKPDEKLPNLDADYSVSADQPRKIKIPSIGVEGFIQKVGKDQMGDIAVPTNVHYSGWYMDSVKPGEVGLSIIDGHVSSRYGSAIFAKLHSLRVDDNIQIEFGDGSVKRFKVVDRQELPEAGTAQFLFAKRDNIESQLNLVTCIGWFNKKSRQYSSRLVIVTTLIN